MATMYRVDYHAVKNGTRRNIHGSGGSIAGDLRGIQTESAVVKYLSKKHPGAEIEIAKLEFY